MPESDIANDADATQKAEADAKAAEARDDAVQKVGKAARKIGLLSDGKPEAGKAQDAGADAGTAGGATGADEADETAEADKGGKARTRDDDAESAGDQDATKAPKLTQRQREAARMFGMDKAAILALGDKAPELLDGMAKKYDQAMTRIGEDRRQVEAARAALREEIAGATKGAEAAPKADAQAEKSGASDDGSDEEPELLTFTQDDLYYGDEEESGANKLNTLAQHVHDLRRELAGLRKDHAKALETVQDMEEAAARAEIDEFFAGLDAKTFPQFGGPDRLETLDEDGDAFQARAELIEDGLALRRGMAAAGESRTRTWCMNRLLLGGKAADQIRVEERTRVGERAKARNASRDPRSGNRQGGGRQVDAREQALALVKKKAQDMNLLKA